MIEGQNNIEFYKTFPHGNRERKGGGQEEFLLLIVVKSYE